ncbi:hypothetical protein OIO90_002425 [Microbotryomycetes sp. JL221]|nr:hypothetical protein OIO90_002425 [Microbotryomycetes sp. JL221]
MSSQSRAQPVVTVRRSLAERLWLTTKWYGPLGFTAFGGPSANIVLIQKIFVQKEKWVDDQTFNDLLALGNALPGPSFSQLAFSISCLHDGTLAGLWSFFLLTAPCAFIMAGVAFGVRNIPNTLPDIVFALFTGINAAAVGLVALAAYQLTNKVVTDGLTRLLLFISGAVAACYEAQWLYPVLMVWGGASTVAYDKFVLHRRTFKARKRENATSQQELSHSSTEHASSTVQAQQPTEEIELDLRRPEPVATKSIASSTYGGAPESTLHLRRAHTSGSIDSPERYPTPPLEREHDEVNRAASMIEQQPIVEETYFNMSVRVGLVIAGVYFAILIAMLVARAVSDHHRALDFATNLLLAGTLIFGGGPVVIPLLQSSTVEPGWISPRDFLLGFAIQQAMPGPVFCFTAYLGVLILPEAPVAGALLGVTAIFLPGIMLKLAFLPLYQRWKTSSVVRSILRGTCAAAIGLIWSAVYRLFRVGLISADSSGVRPAVTSSLDRDGFLVSIVAGSFTAAGPFNVPAPFAIAGGALAGIIWYAVRHSQGLA